MMVGHARSETLFYYFRLQDQVSDTHPLRLIEKHIRFAFVREKLKQSYSDTGRSSIDTELLLRILLIGYLYSITRERKLVEELRRHLVLRWFTRLVFDQEIPHHSTFSKNRHGRFLESKLFEQLFQEIVARYLEAGLVEGDSLAVDGGFGEVKSSRLLCQSQCKFSAWLLSAGKQLPQARPIVHASEIQSAEDPNQF